MNQSIVDNEKSIENEVKKNEDLAEINKGLDGTKDELKEEYEGLMANYLKEKDEPVRLGKGNENLKIAVDHLKTDLEELVRDTQNIEKHMD